MAGWTGLTTEQAEALGFECHVCHRPRARVVIVTDHDHKTGLIRGRLCRRCNDLLGVVHDDAELLASLAGYLLSPPAVRLIGEHYVPGSRGAEGKL